MADKVRGVIAGQKQRQDAAFGGDDVNARIDHAVVPGIFTLDGETFDVENNVWVVGDDECAVIDAPHSVQPILELVGSRRLRAILVTHAHDDHVRIATALAEATSAPVLLHPDDLPVWRLTYPDQAPTVNWPTA